MEEGMEVTVLVHSSMAKPTLTVNTLSEYSGLDNEYLLDCASSLQKQLSTPEVLYTPTGKGWSASALPTLEESPSDDTNLTENTTRTRKQKQKQSTRKESKCKDASLLNHEEINNLKDEASRLALKGSEDKALRAYKRALRSTRKEVARIKRQLQLAGTKPQNLRQTIHIQLHDKWAEVALIVADIQTMMAIIYERIGNYERAIACCIEAQDVFERQARFEKIYNQERSVATQNAEQMKDMAKKMKDARDSLDKRRMLHEGALQVHRQIGTTSDSAVNDMLYEDVFEKLSDVLLLELDSLGGSHPQVADTLGFLSQVYTEKGEPEKALDSMRRAVTIAELSLGICHPRTGEKYRDLARLYERLRRNSTDEDTAIKYYHKAIRNFQESCGDHTRIVGSILNDVGVLHIQRKEYDTAIQKLSDSLASYESGVAIDEGEGVCSDVVQGKPLCYKKRRSFAHLRLMCPNFASWLLLSVEKLGRMLLST
jgi:tetratricopeptide (TPR) repeat protein